MDVKCVICESSLIYEIAQQGENDDFDLDRHLQKSMEKEHTPNLLKVKAIRCGHCFHSNCLDNWFQRQLICPVCRYECVDRNSTVFPLYFEKGSSRLEQFVAELGQECTENRNVKANLEAIKTEKEKIDQVLKEKNDKILELEHKLKEKVEKLSDLEEIIRVTINSFEAKKSTESSMNKTIEIFDDLIVGDKETDLTNEPIVILL